MSFPPTPTASAEEREIRPIVPRPRRSWTPAEDKLLRAAILTVEGQSNEPPHQWNMIAEYVPSRSNKDCRKRWQAQMARELTRGPWTTFEDDRLIEGCKIHGSQWTLVAAVVMTRNSDQCAKRWSDAVNPQIDHSPWTPEEDVILCKAVEEHNRLWAYIVREYFPRRTGLSAKNRYNLLTRPVRKRNTSTNPCIKERDSSGQAPQKKRRVVSLSVMQPVVVSPPHTKAESQHIPTIKAETWSPTMHDAQRSLYGASNSLAGDTQTPKEDQDSETCGNPSDNTRSNTTAERPLAPSISTAYPQQQVCIPSAHFARDHSLVAGVTHSLSTPVSLSALPAPPMALEDHRTAPTRILPPGRGTYLQTVPNGSEPYTMPTQLAAPSNSSLQYVPVPSSRSTSTSQSSESRRQVLGLRVNTAGSISHSLRPEEYASIPISNQSFAAHRQLASTGMSRATSRAISDGSGSQAASLATVSSPYSPYTGAVHPSTTQMYAPMMYSSGVASESRSYPSLGEQAMLPHGDPSPPSADAGVAQMDQSISQHSARQVMSFTYHPEVSQYAYYHLAFPAVDVQGRWVFPSSQPPDNTATAYAGQLACN